MPAVVQRCRGCWGWPRAGQAWGRSSLTAHRHPCSRSWCYEHQMPCEAPLSALRPRGAGVCHMAGLLPDRNPALAGVSPRSVARRPTRGAACITPYLPPNHVSPWGLKSLTCVTTPAGLTRLWAGSPGGRGNDGETNSASSAAGRGGRCRTECLVGSTAVSCQFLRSLPAPRYWYRPPGWQPAIGFNHAATVPTDRHRMHGQCKATGQTCQASSSQPPFSFSLAPHEALSAGILRDWCPCRVQLVMYTHMRLGRRTMWNLG